jgi:hypothetical protein
VGFEIIILLMDVGSPILMRVHKNNNFQFLGLNKNMNFSCS